MKNLFFRKGTEKDFSDLATIISTTKAWTCFGIDYDKAVELFKNMEDTIYIAENKEETVGFITLRINGVGNIGAYVRMVAVAEGFRGQGIGRKMIEYVSEIASQDISNLFLICSVENKKAQDFYEKAGFERVGVMKDLVVKGHDEILYRKNFGTLY